MTDGVLTVGGGYKANPRPSQPHVATLAKGQSVKLSRSMRLRLLVTLHYRIVHTGLHSRDAYKVQSAAYH